MSNTLPFALCNEKYKRGLRVSNSVTPGCMECLLLPSTNHEDLMTLGGSLGTIVQKLKKKQLIIKTWFILDC
jgi:hypothetical protein